MNSPSFVSPNVLVPSSFSGTALTTTSPRIFSHSSSQRVRFVPKCVENTVRTETAEEVVQKFWDLTNEGSFTKTLPLFAEDAVYYDMLYSKPFKGKKVIEKHLRNMEKALPKSLCFILDDVAAGTDKVGTRWHVETRNGRNLPFSRGASIYSFIFTDEGKPLIKEAWDFPETPLKTAGLVLPVLRLASKILGSA